MCKQDESMQMDEKEILESLRAQNKELQMQNKKLLRQLSLLERKIERFGLVVTARDKLSTMLKDEREKQENYLRKLMESSPNILIIVDNDRRVTYCSKRFSEVAGFSDFDAVEGRHITDVLKQSADDEFTGRMLEGIRRAVETGETVTIEAFDCFRHFPKPHILGVNITASYDSDGVMNALLIIMLDITEIRITQQKAEQASRVKSEFLSNMSHEMRTPMNAIIGMTLIGKSAAGIEKKDLAFAKIENASTHLLGVINDILDMSKIEANKFELAPQIFRFESMFQAIVNMLKFRVDEKHQEFFMHIDKQIPQTLFGDDMRLAQVITNLLSNAVKFTPEYGILSLDACLLKEENGVCTIQITVTDTGIGISEEQQGRLFHSFVQAENSTSRKFGGTGLGLAISKRIIEMMGGEIWVVSELGKGSTFGFTIDAVHRDDQPAFESEELPVEETDDFGGCSLLLVEDIEINREIALELLESTGLAIDCAENGVEAVAMFAAAPEKYDMILMDVQMPEMDGYEATRRIRAFDAARAATIPIIAMTANVFREDIEKCLTSGMNAHLGKPLDINELLKTLRVYLAQVRIEAR
jgi:PAS domain S-box-containing protein